MKGQCLVSGVVACLPVPGLTGDQCCPPCCCLWSLCGYLGSELGKSGVVGISMGIISGAERFPVQTWRARREPGDTAASWVTTEKQRITGRFSFSFWLLQEVLSWKNRNGGFEKVFSVSFMISSGRKIKQFNVPTGFSFLQFVCGVQQWPYPSWWYFYLLCYQCRSPKIFL